MTKLAENCGLDTFTEEILNGILHFLCSDSFLSQSNAEYQKVSVNINSYFCFKLTIIGVYGEGT